MIIILSAAIVLVLALIAFKTYFTKTSLDDSSLDEGSKEVLREYGLNNQTAQGTLERTRTVIDSLNTQMQHRSEDIEGLER